MRKKSIKVTFELKIFLLTSSLTIVLYGFMNENILYCASILTLYVISKEVLAFPCYLIIDVHFLFWLHIFLSEMSIMWPTSIVMSLYFGAAVFKRKANFAESVNWLN